MLAAAVWLLASPVRRLAAAPEVEPLATALDPVVPHPPIV
jgi:hypothetical protein